MRKIAILFWVTTGILVLLDSVIPGLTFNSQLAIDSIHHLGYPDYFRIQLTVFKVIGGILLIAPPIPARLKEWAYVGFGINFISACIAHLVVDGVNGQALFPVVALGLLIASYLSYRRLIGVASVVAAIRKPMKKAA